MAQDFKELQYSLKFDWSPVPDTFGFLWTEKTWWKDGGIGGHIAIGARKHGYILWPWLSPDLFGFGVYICACQTFYSTLLLWKIIQNYWNELSLIRHDPFEVLGKGELLPDISPTIWHGRISSYLKRHHYFPLPFQWCNYLSSSTIIIIQPN